MTVPELPEVETTLRGIAPSLIDNKIVKIKIIQPKLRWLITPALCKEITNKKISKLTRRGKYIIIHIDHGGYVLIHLGMSGSLRICSFNDIPKKHDHVIFNTSTAALHYHDPRRFGAILWTDNYLTHPLLSKMGPEPLNDAFNVDYTLQKLQPTSRTIKSVIMDNAFTPGVGNIYAAEALFLANIHPETCANQLPKQAIVCLVKHIKTILEKAIKIGGTTLRDFTDPKGNTGYFKQQLFVYGRQGKPCRLCQTILEAITISQRKSVYCPSCQTKY